MFDLYLCWKKHFMKKINKELYQVYLKQQLAHGSDEWAFYWNKINKLTGKSMDFTCPEYEKAKKTAEKIKNSLLYKALEEE